MLDVWVAKPGAACRVDEQDWTIHVSDAHRQPYEWAGTSFAAVAAPNAHWAGIVPPGTYVVHATRKARRAGEPTRADATIVDVGCDGVSCVRLFVDRPRREPERPDEERPDPKKKAPRTRRSS